MTTQTTGHQCRASHNAALLSRSERHTTAQNDAGRSPAYRRRATKGGARVQLHVCNRLGYVGAVIGAELMDTFDNAHALALGHGRVRPGYARREVDQAHELTSFSHEIEDPLARGTWRGNP